MHAVKSENVVTTHFPSIGPHNTQNLLTYLDILYRDLIPENERGLVEPDFVIVLDNVSLHHCKLMRE